MKTLEPFLGGFSKIDQKAKLLTLANRYCKHVVISCNEFSKFDFANMQVQFAISSATLWNALSVPRCMRLLSCQNTMLSIYSWHIKLQVPVAQSACLAPD